MRSFLDKLGMVCSTVCGVHCLLMPFLLVFIPYASIAWAYSEVFEMGFLLFSVSLAAFTMMQGMAIHGERQPLFFALMGFGLFGFSLVHGGHGHDGASVGQYVIYGVAGLLICVAHYLNHKLCHLTHHCKCK